MTCPHAGARRLSVGTSRFTEREKSQELCRTWTFCTLVRDARTSWAQDSFDLFDKDGTGTIDAEDLWVVMRALGCEPKKEDIKRLVSEVDTEGTSQIDFNGYLQVLCV